MFKERINRNAMIIGTGILAVAVLGMIREEQQNISSITTVPRVTGDTQPNALPIVRASSEPRGDGLEIKDEFFPNGSRHVTLSVEGEFRQNYWQTCDGPNLVEVWGALNSDRFTKPDAIVCIDGKLTPEDFKITP